MLLTLKGSGVESLRHEVGKASGLGWIPCLAEVLPHAHPENNHLISFQQIPEWVKCHILPQSTRSMVGTLLSKRDGDQDFSGYTPSSAAMVTHLAQ